MPNLLNLLNLLKLLHPGSEHPKGKKVVRIPGLPILPWEPSLISRVQGELSSRLVKQGQKKDVTWPYLRLAVVYRTVETERLIT